jgi:hypothetical protein
MPNLFNTFSRAALVAIGLALAPAAFAQGTFSCDGGFTPIFTGVGTQNLEATCGVTCPSGQVASVSGNVVSCAPGGGGDVGPSGCTLTSSASSVASGGGVTLTAKCTGGSPSALDLTWTIPNGDSACPASGTVNQNAQCSVSNITNGGTYSVKFSNGIGSGLTKSVAVGIQSGGGGGFASCPSGAITRSNGWFTNQAVSFNQGTMYSYEMVVPSSGYTTGTVSGGWGYYGGVGTLEYNITTVACDFSGATDVTVLDARGTAKPGSKFHYYDNTGVFNLKYRVGQNLQPGTTYYFNIRSNQCDGTCTEYGNLPKP